MTPGSRVVCLGVAKGSARGSDLLSQFLQLDGPFVKLPVFFRYVELLCLVGLVPHPGRDLVFSAALYIRFHHCVHAEAHATDGGH